MSLIARLIESGVSADLVEEVAMLIAEKRIAEQAIEGRRAKDRERTNRRRSRDVTERHVTERDNTEKPSPSLSPQTPQTHPHPCNNKPASAKAHRLPTDWQPKALTVDLAQAVGSWPDGAEARELARFRDWAASATGTNARKSDWDAAWRNWLRKAEDEGRYASRQADGRGGFKPAVDPLVASILARKAREVSG